ncbi:IS701 family transposase [Streptomyces sp. NPDC101733]|uniref:IS701 family transposase n=1 Tax=unclassified Streptomyces TaxID=2593676 RepID=UPI003827C2D0
MIAHRTRRMRIQSRHPSITAFTEEVFGHLPRQDQRRWAETYLKGLLGTPGKKSVRRMAEAVSATATAPQSLHQFVSASPWAWDPPRRALADWTAERTSVRAWTLAPVVAPKRGDHSVGVHRRFDAAAGRVINCQVGIGMMLSTCCGDVPVDWRLHLPENWCEDPGLRRRARIPESGDPRPLWALALEQVDALTTHWKQPPPPVVTDARELSDPVALVNGLSSRCHKFLVAVPDNLLVHAGPHLGPQRHARALSSANRLCVDDHLLQRGGPARLRPSRSGRVRAALWTLSGPVHLPRTHHTLRLLAKWNPHRAQPARVWVTNLVHGGMDELLALVGTQAGTNTAMQSLREDFGLLDFEGRSFPGWHHHMTLVSAAYAWHRMSASAGHPHQWDPRDAGHLGPAGHAARPFAPLDRLTS